MALRDVRGHVEAREELATLAGSPTGLRGALAGATGTSRARLGPRRQRASQGDALGGPEALVPEVAEQELPEADA